MVEILIPLTTIVIAALFSSLLALKLKIPPVIALIIVGVLLGPYGLQFVSNTDLVSTFAEIGGILLLFLIGMEFSISKIRKLGLNALIVTVVEVGFVFMISYEASIFLGFSALASTFIAITLSITSTALSVKLLQEMGIADKEEIPLLVGVSIIEDLFAIFALAFLSSFAQGITLTIGDIFLSVFKAILIFGVSFFGLVKLLTWFFTKVEYEKHEIVQFTVIALIAGMSLLSILAGFSPSVGAFLAGSIVTSLPGGKHFEETIKHFSLIFVSLFFLSIGMLANPASFIENIGLFIIFAIIAFFGKFIGVFTGTFIAGYSSKWGVFSGVAMIPLGEVSILIAKSGVDSQALNPLFLTMISGLVLFTSLISYPAVLHHKKIHSFLERVTPLGLKNFGRGFTELFSYWRYELGPNGELFNILIEKAPRIVFNTLIIMLIVSFLAFLATFVGITNFLILFLIGLVMSIIPFYRLLVDTSRIVDKLSSILLKEFQKTRFEMRKTIIRELLYAIVLVLFAFFVSPAIGGLLKFSGISIFLSAMSLFFAFFLFYDAGKKIKYSLKYGTGNKYKYKV